MTELTVTFQGTSAAIPSVKRGLSAITLQRGGDLLLFDCGEGTQRQMMKHSGLRAPRAIFITHHHGDHFGGLGGLLSTIDMQGYDTPMHIYVPTNSVYKIEGSLSAAGSLPRWAEVVGLPVDGSVTFNRRTANEFVVRPFATTHCKGSQGYIFEEPPRPGRFDPNLARLSGIEPGPDFKRLQNGETVKGLRPEDVMGPARKGRKIVYTGDTFPAPKTVLAAKDADLLIHEATFEDQYIVRAEQTKHSTGSGAGEVAALAGGVGRLVLTHFSPRSDARLTVEQASKHFKPAVMAVDGMSISVPLEA